MFVGSSYLGSIDRLSPASILTSKSGACLGFLLTIVFIIIGIILFIGPTISYFKKQYRQNNYMTIRHEDIQTFTGCDFKMAICFYSKSTGQLVNHTQILQFLNIRVNYISPNQDNYYASVLPCNAQYFKQMPQKQHQFGKDDCFIAPNGLGYMSATKNTFLSIFGFFVTPLCPDPFTCTFASTINQQQNAQRLQFYSQHYYTLFFTSNIVDENGILQKKYFKVHSSQWQSQATLIPFLYTLLQTARIYSDNSIMPWWNNDTQLYTQWMGLTSAIQPDQITLGSYGFGIMFSTLELQRNIYREYRKLDWLIGMLGGGLFILFVIGWAACNWLTVVINKYDNCQSMILLRQYQQQIKNIEETEKPVLSNPLFHIFSSGLSLTLKCFKNENKTMYCSQKTIDIAQLIKKQKVTIRNLKNFDNFYQFQPRHLDLTSRDQQMPNSQRRQLLGQQEKTQIPRQALQQIKGQKNINKIYGNNLAVLALCNNKHEFQMINNELQKAQMIQDINKRIKLTIEQQNYSKYSTPKFVNSQQSKCKRFCINLKKSITKFITLFDVFGARPNFDFSSQNYSLFGCGFTFIILALAILTFALTLHNMGRTRTYTDQIYKDPVQYPQQNITLTTGSTFPMAICFPPLAFSNNLLFGADRVANIYFYQYQRINNDQKYTYIETQQVGLDQSATYFDRSSPTYASLNLTYCYKPQDNHRVSVYGNSLSNQQGYFGFKMTPYCSGTVSDCSAISNVTVANFYSLLNKYAITFYIPSSKYLLDYGRVMVDPNMYSFTVAQFNASLNFTASTLLQFQMQTLHIIDNTKAWLLGQYPAPSSVYLTSSPINAMVNKRSYSIDDPLGYPYFATKVSLSGVIQRTIFSNYKIDYLFSIIGGCFIFYHFFFGWIGIAYNRYNIKVKLIQILYGGAKIISRWRVFLNYIGLFCIDQDPVFCKIQRQINNINIAKNINNLYKLSVSQYQTVLQKDIGLIYVKEQLSKISQRLPARQVINIYQTDNDQVDKKNEEQISENESRRGGRKIVNQFQSKQKIQEIQIEKPIQFEQIQYENEPLYYPYQANMQKKTKLSKFYQCLQHNIASKYNIYKTDSQLTLDNKRVIKSTFGGLCCIALFIFLCILVSYSVGLYFNQFYTVSYEQVVDQNAKQLNMMLVTGVNISMAVSFEQVQQFSIDDVSAQVDNLIDVSLVKYKVQRVSGSQLPSVTQSISLVKCSNDFLNKFENTKANMQFYQNFQYSYCVPNGVQLYLYGSTQDQLRQYFSIKISNKQSNISSQATNTLLSKYVPRYYVSSPIISHDPVGASTPQLYNIYSFTKSKTYQMGKSRISNLTLVKQHITYNTAVNPSNQYSPFLSYQIKDISPRYQFNAEFADLQPIINGSYPNHYCQLMFDLQQFYQQIKITGIKINQILGIVGGSAVMLFFGLGCIPRSYNEYKLRYMIGCKLYKIQKRRNTKKKIVNGKIKKKTSITKREFSNAVQQNQSSQSNTQISQWKLLLAWISSYAVFLSNKVENNTYKQITIIQSKVTQDINIFEFMANFYACQSSIRKIMKRRLSQRNKNLDLGRIYMKEIIQKGQENQQACKKIKDMLQTTQHILKNIARQNQWSYWQINKLIQARNKNIDTSLIFTRNIKLDQYFGIEREPLRSRDGSHIGNSQSSSTNYENSSKKSSKISYSQNQSEIDNNLNKSDDRMLRRVNEEVQDDEIENNYTINQHKNNQNSIQQNQVVSNNQSR